MSPRRDDKYNHAATEYCLLCGKNITATSSISKKDAVEQAKTDMDKHYEDFHNRRLGQ